MANVGQKVRVGDDMHNEEEKCVDPNAGEGNNDEEVHEVNLEANNAVRGRNGPRRGNREAYYNESDCQTVVNFMMQSKVVQSALPLLKTQTLAGNANAQKEGLATMPTVPQHEKRPGNSHR
ncbi:hypothetical protein ACSBR1_002408 [Camellia fascicularis]